MKTLFQFIILLIFIPVSAQIQVKKSSISTEGGTATAGNYKIIYAIGEVAVSEQNQGTYHISEGFIGPDLMQTLGVENYTQLTGINIFPNPTPDLLNINFTKNGNYQIVLFDLSGKEILNKKINNSDKIQLHLSRLNTAVYFLNIIDRKNKKYFSFKIEKSK